ncbi:hypothetical protein [Mongoliitalea lutea]|uniref:Uncharacterized protein n=1 Tax=Mongoliitalea lutea TaxID=849756 RepID=A0A8J3G4J0_9BACT|nr:hypothetical protein [Mongoliitalea lutea]GHB29330.1 hypothetical protein GCM10008106_07810 [Mongoliitalea lutea]
MLNSFFTVDLSQQSKIHHMINPKIAEIKKSLNYLDEKELRSLLLDIIGFTTDNKRYAYFKLHEQQDEHFFLVESKEFLGEEFGKASMANFWSSKKSLQKLRSTLNKMLKFTKRKEFQLELILFFCEQTKEYGYLDYRHPVIHNLYHTQLRKAENLISKLHEDLQYDYQMQLEELAVESE